MLNPLITRFILASAAAGVHVPECSLGARENENCKTKPTEHLGTSTRANARTQKCQTKPMEHSGTSARAVANTKNCKTNPTEHFGTSPLSNRQLAAARYLARGRGSTETARKLNITRQTVARWWHNPAFAAEVQRLHERITRAAVAPRMEMK